MESEGFATVALALVRGQIERSKPPRAMYTEFPLGRPLGKPLDPEYQTSVIMAAFDLLNEPEGPVLVDFPDVIEEASSDMLACAIPPSYNPALHPAVDEAIGLRAAYNRSVEKSGRTSVGRTGTADDIPALIEIFVNVADGVPLADIDVPGGDHIAVAMDLRSYYEEAALALSDHVPLARQAETWIYQGTKLGELLHAAQAVLKNGGADRRTWFYVMPSTQHRPEVS